MSNDLKTFVFKVEYEVIVRASDLQAAEDDIEDGFGDCQVIQGTYYVNQINKSHEWLAKQSLSWVKRKAD